MTMKPLPSDKRCPTCLRPLEYPKSVAQRNKFHAICREVGLHLGETPGHIKAAIKQDFFGMDEFKVGDKWYRTVRSSEDAERIEYGELIEAAYRFAAEQGLELK